MIFFGILAYAFLDSGFNTKTLVKVEYEDNSNVYFKVNYLDSKYNNIYTDKYVSNMVDTLDINYNYSNILSEYVSGYYRYNVEGYLVAYEDDITSSLWERKYQLVEERTVLLDENNVNNINIDESFNLDFRKYRDEITEFVDDSGIDVFGYMHIRINILEFFNFDGMINEYADNKVITMNIPLTDEIFKVTVNNLEDRDSYYEFSSNRAMNIVFLLVGAFCFAMSITSIVMIIRQFKIIYSKESKYKRKLRNILSKYDECIVRVNRFYVNKKYNMIYVDSFDELMDVYYKKCKMISFKEVKRDSESIFVIIDDDDAWIYRLEASNLE